MEWKKYQGRASGRCEIDLRGEGVLADFEIGIIETGRSRVFAGYYIKVITEDGEEWVEEDPGSVRAALQALDELVAFDGGRLLCAGLHPDFYESGLSANTGFGYIESYRGAVHMMERPSLISECEQQAPKPSGAAKVLAAMRERSRAKQGHNPL